MSRKIISATGSFRQAFSVPNMDLLRWYPGHMFKGMERIQATLKDVDCVIEIHDARIPISGRNPRFRDILTVRPHVLLLNKSDLADLTDSRRTAVRNHLNSIGVDTVFFTDLRNYEKNRFVQNKILPKIIELTESRPRFVREGYREYNIMVIGVPNVGKSTFINTVRWAHIKRKGRAAAVGAIAGVTRSVANKIKVKEDPLVYLVDTPGIFTPKVPNVETGMRLALCACLPDAHVEEERIADFLLYTLNKQQNFSYVSLFDLGEPSDAILDVLSHIAVQNQKVLKIRDPSTNSYKYKPNFQAAANMMLKAFREGWLGKSFLDDDRLQ